MLQAPERCDTLIFKKSDFGGGDIAQWQKRLSEECKVQSSIPSTPLSPQNQTVIS